MSEKKSETAGHRLMIKLRNRFLAGIMILIPLAITIWALWWVFSRVDDLLQPLISQIFGHTIPGLGLGIFIVLIFITGIIASNYVGKKIIYYTEKIATRVPVFRQLYTSVKQLVDNLSGAGLNKAAFREVVYVDFPREGMKTLAFVTNVMTDSSGEKFYAIYVPTAPIPTSGYFEMVREDKLVHTDIPVDEAMKIVISSGMILPKEISERDVKSLFEESPDDGGRKQLTDGK